jgi:hypothetical protein
MGIRDGVANIEKAAEQAAKGKSRIIKRRGRRGSLRRTVCLVFSASLCVLCV